MLSAESDTLPIETVIGSRVESQSVVIETRTAAGRIGLKLSAGVAADLQQALAIALSAAKGCELPEFLRLGPTALADEHSALSPAD